MNGDTDPAADTVDGWNARLGWAFGLVADEPAVRAAASERLAGARERIGEAIRRLNAATRPMGAHGPDPAFLKAAAQLRAAYGHALPDALWNRAPGDIRSWPGLPYALLFLEWEARFPGEWTLHAKKWGTKQALLRDVAVPGHTAPVRAELARLVEIVVQRPYRCKDRGYAGVARAVDGPDLRAALTRAARTGNVWARRHAGYVLWLLDRPGLPNSPHVWHTWNSTEFDGPASGRP